MNPYQPPTTEIRYPSFAGRLRRAFQRAAAEYQLGLQREQISTARHLQSWLSLLMLIVIGAFIVSVWTFYFLEFVGVL